MRPRLLAVVTLVAMGAVSLHAQPNTLTLPSVSGRAGAEIVVSLQADFPHDSVSGIAATVLFDPTVVRVTDVALTQTTNSFNMQTRLTEGELHLAMAAVSGISGVGSIADITLRLIGAPGSASILDLAYASLNEGGASVQTRDGMVTVLREFKVVGSVFYHDRVRPVPDVWIRAQRTGSGVIDSAVTDVGGGYVLGPMEPGDYLVVCSKEDPAPVGISALDVADILRYLVGDIDLSVNQQLSADVSGNGQVGTMDASLILRYLVGLETEFPAGDMWQFTPAQLSVTLLTDRFQNFTSYLLGDVNGDWQAPAPTPKRVSAAEAELDFRPLLAADEQTASVELVAADVHALRGGQLEVRYDAAALRVDAVRAAELTSGFMVASNTETPGLIRIAFAGAAAVEGDGSLLRLDFVRLGTQPTAHLEVSAASLNDIGLSPLALPREELVLGSLATAVMDETGVLPQSTGLEPSYPNPFNSGTTIRYRVRSDAGAWVSVAVYSLTGQRVRVLVDQQQVGGFYSVSWDGKNDQGAGAATGVYLIRLEAGADTDTRSVLYLK